MDKSAWPSVVGKIDGIAGKEGNTRHRRKKKDWGWGGDDVESQIRSKAGRLKEHEIREREGARKGEASESKGLAAGLVRSTSDDLAQIAGRLGGEAILRPQKRTDLMGVRGQFLVILVLLTSCLDGDARSLVTFEGIVPQFNYLNLQIIAAEDVQNENVCTLCEQFASQGIYYLGDNQTQTEIIHSLHVACKQLHSFSHQCVALVDYYAPLFFMEVAMVNPEELCAKVNLCERDFMISQQQKQDGCEICHKAIAEILLKLKDPDTQLEVIEILLKGCEKVENHVKECKRMVLEYGPLLMTNAEKFLETRDVCRTIRACKAPGSVFTNLPSMIKRVLTAGALNEVM